MLTARSRANETAKSSRAIGVCCAMTIFELSRHWSPRECESGRQAKVGENATGGLQHMGALRPDLSIEAMIKIKMEPNETEVRGPYERGFDSDSKPPILEMGQYSI